MEEYICDIDIITVCYSTPKCMERPLDYYLKTHVATWLKERDITYQYDGMFHPTQIKFDNAEDMIIFKLTFF